MAKTCDFLCIGAGIAGASSGYELSKHGKVIIAERENAPDFHSTGRSAAMYSAVYESTVISALTSASHSFLENAVDDGFAKNPVLNPRGILCIARPDQQEALDKMMTQFGPLVPSLEKLDQKDALALDGTSHLNPDYMAGAAWEPEGKDIDVHELHQSYLKDLKANKGEVLLNAEVRTVTRRGDIWRVETATDTIETQVIVNAAGAWADQIAALAGAKPIGLTPLRRTVITFGGLPPTINVNRLVYVRDIEELFYFRPEGGHLLGSPADETPVPPGDVQPEELDIAVAADRIEPAICFPIRKIDHKWAGLRNFTADRMPVAGFDSDLPGFFWLTGQGGAGIMTAPALARITASLITSQEIPADIAAKNITADILSPARCQKN